MPDPTTSTPPQTGAKPLTPESGLSGLSGQAAPESPSPGYAVLPRLAPRSLSEVTTATDASPLPAAETIPHASPPPPAQATPDTTIPEGNLNGPVADTRMIPDIATVPETAAIGVVAVPQTAPPFDDALSGDHPLGRCGTDEIAPVPAVPISSVSGAGLARRARVSDTWRPPGGHWPSQFAQLLAEALAGSRPASHLAPWTSARTRRKISQLAAVLATPHRPRIRRVIVTSPASGILEMSVIAVFGTRVRALAVRLERRSTTPDASARPAEPAPLVTAGLAEGWSCTVVEAA